jgi:nucleotide-binding universal stress UspA family protein
MAFVGPFDGSELAETAPVRAAEFGDVLEERVVAVTVITAGNEEYAQERDWLGTEEAFALDDVVATIHERVVDLCPAADFRHARDEYAPTGTITNGISRLAREEDAAMPFVGSENAGRVVTSVSSVGGSVSSRVAFDVVIVRNKQPSKVARLRERATAM